MIQLNKRHKAIYLKDEIIKCLKIYKIDVSQIYSSTTDNGANVVKVSKILQEIQEEQLCEELNDIDSSSYEDDEENIQSSLASVLSVVRCAAHTIQLAAYDILKQLELKINECRSLVKKVRTFIKAGGQNIQMPVLDNATRWNSTYEMLKSLIKIREFVDTVYLDTNNVEISWDFINDFVAALSPLAKCTKQLQTQNYIIGDFYRDWLNCEIELAGLFLTSPHASLLHEAMQTRKKLLLENDAFVAALYLDPRFNFANSLMMCEEQKTKAVTHLVKTFEIIKRLENSREEIENSSDSLNNTSNENIEEPSTSRSAYAKLTQYIIANATGAAETHRSFKQKLLLLENRKMYSLETDVLKYWHSNDVHPDILKVVDVALAVPATQVSVERAFSALSVILTKLRSKLNNSTINNLLLTKLNFMEINPDNVHLEYIQDLIEQ